LRKEGEAIQKLLSRPSKMSMRDLLASFSMQDLSRDLMTVAPTLWGVLTSVSSQRKSRREKELVCFYSNLCYAQKANNFQVIMGFFLLGSGAGKGEMAVLAQAGLSVSLTAINKHIKQLSRENITLVQKVLKSFLCSI
ncbi:hypothetical protein BT96DRAFT_797932, partial [Gymnopus androsaceus JB14]